MQSVSREKAVKKEESPPKQMSVGKESMDMGAKEANGNMKLKDPNSDGDEDPEGGSETSVKGESQRSKPSVHSLRDNAARYAALRNHRIRFEDAIDPNAERVKTLNKNDVIFGRGRGYQNHPGNLRMRTIIEKYKNDYHCLKRQGKREMVEKVYQEIVEDGARFLKKLDDEDEWVKVDVPIALQKVSHTLRCRKKSAGEVLAETASPLVPPETSSLAQLHAQAFDLTPSVSAADQISRRTSLGMLQDRSALALGAGSLPAAANPYLELEAQRLAVLQNRVAFSGLPSMSSLMQPMHSTVDYYNMLRRDQLVRETIALQHMAAGQATAAMGNSGLHLHQMNTASFPSLSQGSIYDRLQLMQQRSAPNEQPPPSDMGHPPPRYNPSDRI